MALFGGIEITNRPDPENVRKLDLLPINQIRRMQRVGIAIDPEWFRMLSADFEKEKTELKKDICSYIPPDRLAEVFGREDEDEDEDDEESVVSPEEVEERRKRESLNLNVDSAEQIARLLFEVLEIGKGTKLKTTKTGDRLSTGKKQLEALKLSHPIIPKLLEYREIAKLQNTYTNKLPRIAVWHPEGKDCQVCGRRHWEGHYRIHTKISTTRTGTGRLASSNPNLNNIPARSKRGRLVRKGFRAQLGYRLIDRDYAQIELRGMADQAGDKNMIRIFRAGGDIHLDTAMRAFRIDDPKKVDKLLHRAPCKNVNFGVGYGLGPEGLLDLMILTFATALMPIPDWLTLQWCEDFIQQWFALYPECQGYFTEMHRRCLRYGISWTPMGRVRRIPEVYSVHERVRMAGLRQGGNAPIQGFAADIFKIGLARTEHLYNRLRLDSIDVEALIPIHDEQLTECMEDYAEDVNEVAGLEMDQALVDEQTGVLCCRVPILTDGKTSQVWEKD